MGFDPAHRPQKWKSPAQVNDRLLGKATFTLTPGRLEAFANRTPPELANAAFAHRFPMSSDANSPDKRVATSCLSMCVEVADVKLWDGSHDGRAIAGT